MFEENEFIPSLLEQSVERRLDRLFGDFDPQLRFIKKLDLLNDNSPEYTERMHEILKKIKQQNEFEYKSIFAEERLILNDKVDDDETKEADKIIEHKDIEQEDERL